MMNEAWVRTLFLLIVALFSVPLFTHALTVEITATVAGCGDGAISSGEQCDGSNLGGSSCSLLGFSSGSLSCTSACTFNTSNCSSSSSGGSSGGGSSGGGGSSSAGAVSPSIPSTNVVFSGRAYPLSRVSILKDGQLAVTTISGPDSNFTATISGLSTGNYTFSVRGEDNRGVMSSLFTFPIFISSGVTTKIGGIFIAPTISTDKKEVRRGDTIAIFGQSAPQSEVTVSVNSPQEFFIKKIADMSGAYLINFDTSVLDMGEHHTKSKAILNDEATSFGDKVRFLVGTQNVSSDPVNASTVSKTGDANGDARINLVDFSVVAYWYKRPNPPATVDINKDGKVDLVDFSIMAFHWTG